jgi:IS5 family transposase
MKPKKLEKTSFFGTFLYDKIIPEDHLLRLAKKSLDWKSIHKELKRDWEGKKIEYSHTGQPAVNLLTIFKLLFLQRWHPASDRNVCERAKYDISYRLFLDLPFPLKIPDFTNLSKLRKRWGKERLEEVFKNTFQQIQQWGYANVAEGLVGDITHSHARIQRPSARALLIKCFHKYLGAALAVGESYSEYYDLSQLRKIEQEVIAWFIDYNLQIQQNQLTRKERFEFLIQIILSTQYKIRRVLPLPLLSASCMSPQGIHFQEICEFFEQIIRENVLLKTTKEVEEEKEEEKQKEGKKPKATTALTSPDEKLNLSNVPTQEQPQDTAEEKLFDPLSENFPRITQKKGERKIISDVDPEVRAGCKAKTKFFVGTKVATTMTTDDFIVGVDTLPGNVSDGTQAISMLEKAEANSGQTPPFFSLDKGFNTMENRLALHARGVQPGIEFEKGINPRNPTLYTTEAFEFDSSRLTVTCPAGQTTKKYTTTKKTATYTFRFPSSSCVLCSKRKECTTSKSGRTVSVSTHQELIAKDKAFLKTRVYNCSRKKRWNLESRYGNGKQNHALSHTPYWGTNKNAVHHLLVCMVLNVKKLITKLYFSSNSTSASLPVSGASV